MTDALREYKADLAEAAVRALYKIAEDILAKAINLAPLDEGTLRGSGLVTIIVNGMRTDSLPAAIAEVRRIAMSGGLLTMNVEVSFNTPYAARQHEELDWLHPKGGQAQYLGQPFAQAIPRAREILQLAMDHPHIR